MSNTINSSSSDYSNGLNYTPVDGDEIRATRLTPPVPPPRVPPTTKKAPIRA